MANENKKWVKLGAIKASKKTDANGKSTGSYISLGTPKSKYEPSNVRIVVTDLKGNTLADVTNPTINVQNPRKRVGITAENLAKIPEYLLAELSLPPAKE